MTNRSERGVTTRHSYRNPFVEVRGLMDARTRFRDLSRIPPSRRRPQSLILQFYSARNNIGNYLPVLGIRQMLGMEPDAWDAHDSDIDFGYINRHYHGVIIGGAGLLHSSFESFWRRFFADCQLPAVIWGIGLCAPDTARVVGVERTLITRNQSRFDLINLRDHWTAEFYQVERAHISACPTVVALSDTDVSRRRSGILVVSHPGLTDAATDGRMRLAVSNRTSSVRNTDNVQRRFKGIQAIINSYYARSARVVTTRLHGAIISAGLGIPYIALARDTKLRAFHREFGSGELVEEIAELEARLEDEQPSPAPISRRPVLAFGDLSRDWVSSMASNQ